MGHEDLVTVAFARQATRSGLARLVRLSANLSQREVAASVEVDVSTISRWESGERLPRGAAAIRYGRLIEALVSQQRGSRRKVATAASSSINRKEANPQENAA